MTRRTMIVLSATVVTAVGAAGTAPATPTPAHPAFSSVTFTRYTPNAGGVSYDETLVPPGSGATVLSLPGNGHGDGTTTVILRVRGLLPDHLYGAHVHENGCGATGDAAGRHYQNEPDPVQPSVDPNYANPHNEIWLDLTTDDDGNAESGSTVDWQFADRHAGSVVIHAEHTHTAPGEAGTAGARLACVSVDF